MQGSGRESAAESFEITTAAGSDNPVGAPFPQFPPPVPDPLAPNRPDDPILAFLQKTIAPDLFDEQIARAVARAPASEESAAAALEAQAAKREARSGLFPTIDVGISNRTSLARNFSNDPDNILERSRARGRTDATFSLNQILFDFGATSIRISAASERLRAASLDIERQADEVALQAIAAWYDVFSYRLIVEVADRLEQRQQDLRSSMSYRIEQGVSSRADLVRIDSQIAAGVLQKSSFARELAEAELRFTQLFGAGPPANMARPPDPVSDLESIEAVRAAALGNPVVELTRAQARAAQQDARAARSDTLPRLSAGIEGGRFGLFETDNDYDVRAVVNLQYRFFGPGNASADQASARAQAADARARRLHGDAVRFAAVAWTDIAVLEDQLAAAENAYLAARKSRDIVQARFASTRGTLFDIIDSESSYFSATIDYVSALNELGAARYVLLSRTGRLLERLSIEMPAVDGFQRVAP